MLSHGVGVSNCRALSLRTSASADSIASWPALTVIAPSYRPAIDELVLEYLRTFIDVSNLEIAERWHGIYVKHPTEPYCVLAPEDGVTAVAALGGHGMTLSFGLAEHVVRQVLG